MPPFQKSEYVWRDKRWYKKTKQKRKKKKKNFRCEIFKNVFACVSA